LGDVADLDRTVEIDSTEGGNVRVVVSALRDRPHVVLLGEPGLGKSTILDREARAAGATRITVRHLLSRGPPAGENSLFLDALDEFRSDGSNDKIYALADAIEKAGSGRWWLTCRAEDWRKLGDLEVLKDVTVGRPITVAHLQSLDQLEQIAALRSFGEADPEAFLETARRLGAEGFLVSPLSLRLLHRAVGKGSAWPKTRFELFDRATLDLAGEHNPARRTAITRPAPVTLREAAARTFLIQLASGAHGVWRSNVEPEGKGLISGFDLGIDQIVLSATLDTALFTGEGEAFEPIHRSVAEFLAARALVDAVIGSPGTSALPLGRALALITTDDGGPPTEFRGLFGWFVVHLAERGRTADALALTRSEPVTVLAYGDAAALPTDCRRALFEGLDSKDPWFGFSQGSAMVGSLAGEDLADLFTAVIDGASSGTDKLSTVLEALTVGSPVVSLRPKLRAICFDEQRSEGMRRRALDAYLNGSTNLTTEQRSILDGLTALAPSNDNGALKAHLIAQMAGDNVTVADLKSLIIDAASVPRRNRLISLYGVCRWFERNPKSELLNSRVRDWLPAPPAHGVSPLISLEGFFDSVVATLIAFEQPSPTRLQAMLKNSEVQRSARFRDATTAAVATWLAAGPERPIEFLAAIVASTVEPNRVGKILVQFHALALHLITPSLIRAIIARAEVPTDDRVLWFELASALVWRVDDQGDIFWEVVNALRAHPDVASLADRMVCEEIEQWRWEEAARRKERNAEALVAIASNVATMLPELDRIRSGVATGWLNWGAEKYLYPHDLDPEVVKGLDRVARLSNASIAEAMAMGWTNLATAGTEKLTPAKLGVLEAQSGRNAAEYPMIAGIIHQRSLGIDPINAPLPVAIAVIRNSHIVMDTQERDAVTGWALDQLCTQPATARIALTDFWLAAINAGSSWLNYMHDVAERCPAIVASILPDLLGKRPNMPTEALGTTLQFAVRLLDRSTLLGLAKRALRRKMLGSDQRARWYATAFRLDPLSYGDQLAAALPDEGRRLFLELAERTEGRTAFDGLPEEATIVRDGALVELIACDLSPGDRWGDHNYGPSQRLRGIATAAISRLATSPAIAASDTLERLLGNPALVSWQPRLRHSIAEQIRVRRDHGFRNPTPGAVLSALAGGPPVNASDLRAIVLGELGRIERALQTSASSSWRRYWNLDGYSRPIDPRNENECRSQVLDLLEVAMQHYCVIAAIPEGQRVNDTRSDMLVLGYAGSNLPVEAKRHYNDELWTAPVDQLEPYTRAPGASGFGIYLVFWFGGRFSPPTRPDGKTPASADALSALLHCDLPEALRARLTVMVFDVSVPPGVKMSNRVITAPKTGKPKPRGHNI
jgi:hypothetical protein